MPTRLVSLVLDCSDPASLAKWWARALGWVVTYQSADEVEIAPVDATPDQLVMGFVPVRDKKTGPNQVHLDLASSSSGDQQRRVATLIAAGARRVQLGQPADALFTVLADPEGNEFCVLEPREQNTGIGPVSNIVLNCEDPAASGPFWALATGWDVISSTEDYVGLRAPDGRGPFLDFNVSSGSGITPRPKDRLHLDVAPRAGEDQQAATDALVAAGARRIDVGQLAPDGSRPESVTWDVLVAPDGHEFCVLSPR